MVQQAQLDYGKAPTHQTPPRIWEVLAAVGVVAPFVTVPVFILGAALLQDHLITGDGLSWYRACVRMAIPTLPITAVGLIGAVRVCMCAAWRRPAVIFGVIGSSLALLFIVYMTVAA